MQSQLQFNLVRRHAEVTYLMMFSSIKREILANLQSCPGGNMYRSLRTLKPPSTVSLFGTKSTENHKPTTIPCKSGSHTCFRLVQQRRIHLGENSPKNRFTSTLTHVSDRKRQKRCRKIFGRQQKNEYSAIIMADAAHLTLIFT